MENQTTTVIATKENESPMDQERPIRIPQEILDAHGAYQKHKKLRDVFSVNDYTTVVAGGEDSGKSSLVCNILQASLAPSKTGTCTKKPLLIKSLQGEGIKYCLLEKNREVKKSDRAGDIYAYLEEMDGNDDVKVTYKELRELRVKIGGIPVSIVDTPGYQSGIDRKELQNAIIAPGGKKTSLVLCVSSLKQFKCNPRSDANIEIVLHAAQKASARMILVLTNVDYLLTGELANPIDTLIRNATQLKADLKTKYNYDFSIILVKCKSNDGGFDFEQIRKDEQEIWTQFARLRDAVDSEGELFQCGVDKIQNIIFNGPFAEATKNTFEKAEEVLRKLAEEKNREIKAGSEAYKPYNLARPVTSQLETPANITKCTIPLQEFVHVYLRKYCGEIFNSRDVPVPSAQSAKTWAGDIQVTPEDIAMENVMAYRTEFKAYIVSIARKASEIYDTAANLMRDHIQVCMKLVAPHQKISDWIMGHFDAFVSDARTNAIEELEKCIRLHTHQVDINAEEAKEVKHWPNNAMTEAAKENTVVAKLVASLEKAFGHLQYAVCLIISRDLYYAFPEKLGEIMLSNKELEISQTDERDLAVLRSDVQELNAAAVVFGNLKKRVREPKETGEGIKRQKTTHSPEPEVKKSWSLWGGIKSLQ